MARIDNLTNFLTDVATAIKNKLDDQTNIPAAEFDDKIMNIQSGGMDYTNTNLTLNDIVNKSVAYSQFAKLYPLAYIINMSQLFMANTTIKYCPMLKTANVADMSDMFNGCSNLVDIPVWNTANLLNAQGMFENCVNLSASALENIANMLPNASNLTNTTVTNIGLNAQKFTQDSMEILIAKGYTDVTLPYNPSVNYVITLNR